MSAAASLHRLATAAEGALYPRQRAEAVARTLREWAGWIVSDVVASTSDLTLAYRTLAVAAIGADVTGPARSRAITCAELGDLHGVTDPGPGDWLRDTPASLRRAAEIWRGVVGALSTSADPREAAICGTAQRELRHLLAVADALEVARPAI